MLSVALLSACGGSQHTDGYDSAAEVPDYMRQMEAPTLFAPMFEKWNTFRYRVTVGQDYWDPDHDEADEYGQVSTDTIYYSQCTVVDVDRRLDAVLSLLECLPSAEGEIGGLWIATERGVFLPGGTTIPEDIAWVHEEELPVMRADPVAGMQVFESYGIVSELTTTQRPDGTWCRAAVMDPDVSRLQRNHCFHESRGLTEWMYNQEGDDGEHFVHLELIPPE